MTPTKIDMTLTVNGTADHRYAAELDQVGQQRGSRSA